MAEELDNNIMNQPGTGFDDATMPDAPGDYNKLVTLEALEHIRRRPGMYIGKLGDGSQSDDGIYVLLKEVLDNAIDEHAAGFGNVIEVEVSDGVVSVRDHGRGIPLGDVTKAASVMKKFSHSAPTSWRRLSGEKFCKMALRMPLS